MDTRRLAAGDQRVAPACPAGGRPPAVPSSPPVARWTRRRGCLQSSRRAVARPSFRPTRRFPGRPGWSLAPGHSGERLPARRPVRPAGCPLGHPESNARPDRRPVSRPSPRQIHRSPEWIIRRGASVRPVARLPALRFVRSGRLPGRSCRRLTPGLLGERLPARRSVRPAGCPASLSEDCLRPRRRPVARPSSRRIRRLPGKSLRSPIPTSPSREGEAPLLPSAGPTEAEPMPEARNRKAGDICPSAAALGARRRRRPRRSVVRFPFRPEAFRPVPCARPEGLPHIPEHSAPTHRVPAIIVMKSKTNRNINFAVVTIFLCISSVSAHNYYNFFPQTYSHLVAPQQPSCLQHTKCRGSAGLGATSAGQNCCGRAHRARAFAATLTRPAPGR